MKYPLSFYRVCFLALGLGAPALHAIDIRFTTAEGYSTTGGTTFANGNLVGQPSGAGVTKWTGSTSAGTDRIRVTSEAGEQFVRTVNSSATSTSFHEFLPGAADLGGTFSPSSSLLTYGFSIRFDDAPITGSSGVLLRPRIGEDAAGNPVTAFEVLADGRFNFNDGSTILPAKTTSGGGTNFIAPTGTYFTVSGVVDYASSTYTVFVNGVAQRNAAGNVWLAFRSTAGKTPKFSLRELSNGTAWFRRLSVDNVHLALGGRLLPEAVDSADDFVEDMGINTHLGQTGTTNPNPYAHANAETLIGQLGIRHIRENLGPTSAYYRLDQLFDAYGIRTTLIGRHTIPPANYVQLLKDHPAIEAIEGLNEPDHPNAAYTYNGLTDNKGTKNFAATAAYQADLYAAIKGDPATAARPVLSPAMAGSFHSRFLAPIPADRLAMHSYADGFMPSSSRTDAAKIRDARQMQGSGPFKPMIATETGYHTAGGYTGYPYRVDATAQAKYLLRGFAEFFNQGMASYIYEVFDEGTSATDKEHNYGVLEYDRDAKPAYTAIKHLVALLGERTWNANSKTWSALSFSPTPLDYTVTGDTQHLRHTLLQRSDGHYRLLLWNDVRSYDVTNFTSLTPPPANVTLRFNQAFAAASTYLLDSLTPTASYSWPRSLTLAVPDEIMVLDLAPAGVPAPWINADIGATGLAGSATQTASVFTLRGAGADIWSTADAFHYVSQPLAGDGEIIAKVDDVSGADGWAKAGLMIRETSGVNSRHASVFVTPSNGVVAQSRSTTGGASVSATLAGTAPRWLKLSRAGNVFSAFASSDGATWSAVGTPVTVTMTNPVQVGLALTAHGVSTLGTAHFSQVSVSVPQVNVRLLANASAWPLRQGVFEITRSGSTAQALTVSYAVGGNAVAGVDYVSLGGSATIPVGATAVRVVVDPIARSNVQGERSIVLTLTGGGAYNLGQNLSDCASYRIGNGMVADFETAAITLTAQTRSSVVRSGTSVDGGTQALQWTYNDDGATDWQNEIKLTLPAAQDWSSAKRLVIRFAEDSANPLTDVGQRLFFTFLNNGSKVSGTGPAAQFYPTKETGYRTIAFNLEEYQRTQVTALVFYASGSQFATGNHVWYIDNITVE